MKRIKVKKTVQAMTMVLAFPCLATAGVNATWVDTSAASGNWMTLANWSGTDRLPTNVSDSVAFSTSVNSKTVRVPFLRNCSGLGSAYLMGLDTVSGLAGYTLDVGAKLLTTYNSSVQHDLLLQVRETSDFHGTWRAYSAGWPNAGAYAGLALVPNAGDVPVVRNVDVAHGFRVIVPSATASAKVGALTSGGRLEANYGANFTSGGAIEMGRTAGGRTDLVNAFGSITFNGTAYPADASVPVAGAWLHLDASQAATLETDGGYVSRWSDVSGNGRYAVPPSEARRPTLRTQSANGRDAIDFGAYNDVASSVAKYGASACMTLNEACSGVREVYFVFEDVESGSAAQQFVGSANAQSAFTRPSAKNDGLFVSGYALPVSQGEIRIDGCRVRATEADDFSKRWHVLSVRTTGAVNINSLAQLGNGTQPGGVRLAEVLVYEKVLTDVERLQNETYLANKWLEKGARDLWDYGWVKVATNVVNVASGTLAIKHLELASGTTELIKEGAGDLRVEWLPPTVTKVTVREGNFAFAGSTKVDDTEAKDTPLVWFDANTVAGSAGDEVSDWTDKRSSSSWHAIPGTNTRVSPNPTKVAGPNGNAAVDFGVRDLATNWKKLSDTSAYMTVKNGSSAMGTVVREAFVVVAFNTTGYSNADAQLTWSDSTLMEPSVYNYHFAPFFDTQGANPIAQASAFWVDGMPIDPRTTLKVQFANVSYHVLNYRLLTRGCLNCIAAHRNADSGTVGGIRVGEILYYDHVLSDADRRDTCAYLMKKWLGTNHPDAGAQSHVTKIVYENATDKTILHASEDASLATVEIPETGAFEKTGDGALTVARLAPEVKALAVSGGSLDATLDLFAGAVFHVDASDAASITTNASGEVTKWSDTDGGSIYASQYRPYSRSDLIAWATTKSVQTATSGAPKTVMDFGSYFKDVGSSWPGSAFANTNSAAMVWSKTPSLKELHIVRADTDWDKGTSGYRYPPMFGFSALGKGVSDCYPFYRLDQQLFQNSEWGGRLFNRGLAEGAIYIDGVARQYTYQPATKQFYVASFVPSNALKNVNMFAGSVKGQIGGQQIGESVVFSRTNTVARRTAIMRHLMRKWTTPDAEGAAWQVALDSITVANGGVLTLRTNAQSDQVASETLSFGFAEDGACSKVVVDGTFALPSTGTLTVTVPTGVKLAAESYPLVEADSVAGGEGLVNWTVVLPDAYASRYRVVAQARGLYLVRQHFGLMMIVQ